MISRLVRNFLLSTSFALASAATLLISGCGISERASAAMGEEIAPPARGRDEVQRVVLPRSMVHELPSEAGRRYQVWVDLPASYATSDKPLPVVFVTDPNFAFQITRTIRDFTGQRGRNIEQFILVGLVHDPDVSPVDSRSRDYTPTIPKNRMASGHAYGATAYGEAEAYRHYVETRVFPLIATTYRADMRRKTFIGHSYGSLFGLHAMFTRPGMFQNYILGSPSLWFDGGVVERMEEAYAAEHGDLRANIVMVAGSYEQPGPTSRHYSDTDLVGDMRRFEKRLKNRGYAGLTVRTEVAESEDHFTVFHDVASRGLIAVLPGTGPYTSG